MERFYIFAKVTTSGPRLFHTFKLIILDKREHSLSDGSGKFQEGVSLASPEPIAIVKRCVFLLARLGSCAHLQTNLLVKEMECSDRPDLDHVLIHGGRSNMGLDLHRMVNDSLSKGCSANIPGICHSEYRLLRFLGLKACYKQW